MSSLPSALTAFIDDLETLINNEQDQRRVATGVQARLPDLLRQPDFLAPEYREPDAARYRSHLLAVAPSRRFSVVSLVWLPGQATPIHDHIAWCVVGVLQGDECEQRYGLRQSPDGDRWLVPLEETRLEVGGSSVLVPPEENIHQVRNAGSELAVSIHVYGADLAVFGSSINQCFGHLAIRSGDLSGACVPWRLTPHGAGRHTL